MTDEPTIILHLTRQEIETLLEAIADAQCTGEGFSEATARDERLEDMGNKLLSALL